MVEITCAELVDIDAWSRRAVIILTAPNGTDMKYIIRYNTRYNRLFTHRMDREIIEWSTVTYTTMEFTDVFNISYDEFMIKNMSGELGNSLQELDIYYNLYLFLIGRITEQDLRNEIVKLFK